MVVITLQTRDANLPRALFGVQLPPPGERRVVADEVSIVHLSTTARRGLLGTDLIIKFVVEVGSQLALGVVGNWLYDIIKNSKVRAATVNAKDISSSAVGEIIAIVGEESAVPPPNSDEGAGS